MSQPDAAVQVVVSNVLELLPMLDEEPFVSANLIAIDGVGGAGKSALAAQIAAAFDRSTHVDLDEFLHEKTGRFFDALRLDDIRVALQGPTTKVIVSGICLLRVLAALQLKHEVLIYIKRMSKFGWADEDEIDGTGLEDTATAMRLPIEFFPMQLEVRDYHRAYLPHRVADNRHGVEGIAVNAVNCAGGKTAAPPPAPAHTAVASHSNVAPGSAHLCLALACVRR